MKRPFLVLFLLLPLLLWGQKEYSLKGTDFWVSVPNGIGIDSILLQVCSHTTCTAIFTIGQNILGEESVIRKNEQVDLFDYKKDEIIQELQQIDVMAITPMDAMNTLFVLREKARKL